jgi:hypothetical protein
MPVPAAVEAALSASVSARLGGAPSAAEALIHNPGNEVTAGLWRVRGPAGSAVLKLVTPHGDGLAHWAAGHEPTHWNYWAREPLAYRSGLAAEAYGGEGIAAPALLDAVDLPDGAVALWLEDAAGTPGTAWSVERLGAFARRLGAAQARWAGRQLPHPWLSRGWLRQYIGSKPVAEPVPWDHPVAAAMWPPELRAGVRRLWEQRGALLDRAERLPRTLCHLDVWPVNLIGAGDGRTVLLDWSFVGDGAVGEDVANLIPDTVADGLVDPALLPEVDGAVRTGYLAGLRDGDWHGPEGALWRAITTTGAAKYAWLAPLMLHRLAAGDGAASAHYDPHSSDAEVFARRVGLLTMLSEWADEALT